MARVFCLLITILVKTICVCVCVPCPPPPLCVPYTLFCGTLQAAKTRKASRIFAIDVNESKFDLARKLGATDCINPKNSETPIQQVTPDAPLPPPP